MAHNRRFGLGGVSLVVWVQACSSPPLGIAPSAADGGADAGSPTQTEPKDKDARAQDAPSSDGANVGYPDAISPVDAGLVNDDASLSDGAGGDEDASQDAGTGVDPITDAASDGRPAYEDRVPPNDVVIPDGGAVDATVGDGGSHRCEPKRCGSQSWACWPMPNSASSGLPNAANYTDMGDGTIRDNVTCLLWQKATPQAGYVWQDAKAFCQTTQSLPGAGWRLPTRIELTSVVDYSRMSPAINIQAFPTAVSNPHWTASVVSGTPTNAWAVSFLEGGIDNAPMSTTQYPVRCVKGNGEVPIDPVSPPGHYAVTLDEVTDAYTGLVWQRADSQSARADPMTWAEASAYCSSLSISSKSWRLPSIQELSTLLDEAAPQGAKTPMAASKEFPTMIPAPYWSWTRVDGTLPWSLDFKDGTMGHDSKDGTMAHKSTAAFAKCVR